MENYDRERRLNDLLGPVGSDFRPAEIAPPPPDGMSLLTRIPLLGALMRARAAGKAGRVSLDFTCPCPDCGNPI